MRVFISHGAKSGRAVEVLHAVEDRLKAAGHDVFVDRSVLGGGDEWRAIIYHELARCDAGVVLLDKRSAQRPWVQREVDIMLWRRALAGRIVILPVLLENIKLDEIDRLRELESIQAVLAHDLSADEIAGKIVGRLGSRAPAGSRCPMTSWFNNIEAILDLLARDRMVLRDMALELGVAEADADCALNPADGRRFVAHQFLVRRPAESTKRAVEKILWPGVNEFSIKLVNLIAPTWVDHAAALPLVVLGPAKRGVAVLNASEIATAHDYVRRATCMSPFVKIKQVLPGTGEDVEEDLWRQCERHVVSFLGGIPDVHALSNIPPAELRNGRSDVSCFLVFNASPGRLPMWAVSETVARLRREYPWIGVIVLIGEEPATPDMVTSWRLTDAVILEPVLGPFEEFSALRIIRELYEMIDNTTQGRLDG